MKIPANGFTHAGKFHADDVFATALLQILRPDIKITRGFVSSMVRKPPSFSNATAWHTLGLETPRCRATSTERTVPFFI